MVETVCRHFVTSSVGAVAKYCDEYVCLLSLCLSVCEDISWTTCMIFTKFLCMLSMSVAQSSSGMLTIGRITYLREGGDGSAQRGRSVIYNCLVYYCGMNIQSGCPNTARFLVSDRSWCQLSNKCRDRYNNFWFWMYFCHWVTVAVSVTADLIDYLMPPVTD